MRVTTASCCASLRPKNAAQGPTIANSFATTVVTPSKCVGRAAPHRSAVSSLTWTVVSGGRGYISATLGVNTQSTPSASHCARSPARSPRVAIEIFVRSELERVHEDRHDDEVGGRAGGPHQRTVALVQEPHRGHDTDPAVARPRLLARGAQVGDSIDVEHASPRSVPALAGPDWRDGNQNKW